MHNLAEIKQAAQDMVAAIRQHKPDAASRHLVQEMASGLRSSWGRDDACSVQLSLWPGRHFHGTPQKMSHTAFAPFDAETRAR
jgi:hypothetical protein